MAKKKVVKKPSTVIPDILTLAATADSEYEIQPTCFMMESLVQRYYLNTFKGHVEKVRAFIVPREEVVMEGRPEYMEYLRKVLSYDKKFVIAFELNLFEEDEDEL